MSPGPTSTLGVLLAAGTGTRFEGGPDDGNKLLAELRGDPVVVRAARTLETAGERGVLDDLVVVLGYEAGRVHRALADAPFDPVGNPDYAAGQATSVRRGAQAARERGADVALFALGDMPFVDPGTVTAVVNGLRDVDATIAVPVRDGRRGNPVAVGADRFDELVTLDGDTGGRDLFGEHAVERVPVDDGGIHQDVDTAADLASLGLECE